MARTSIQPTITTPTARLGKTITIRRDPHWYRLNEGQHLGYRKLERGKGTWIARHFSTEHGRRFQSLGIADDLGHAGRTDAVTFRDAKDKAEAWFKQLETGDKHGVVRGKYTVAQAMEDYATAKEREKRKKLPRTRQTINAHILPTLGDIDLTKLSHGKLKTWRDALTDAAPRVRSKVGKPQAFREFDPNDEDAMRARHASVNRVLTTLKAALNYAREEKKVSDDTAWADIKSFRNVDVPKVRFLTAKEASSLVKACVNDFKPLVQAALLTGCRYGELTAMTVAAFDPRNRSLFVEKSKNGEARHVHLNHEGVAFFNTQANGKKSADALFVRANGKQWEKSEQKRPMDAACNKAKLEQVTFHILRHTYASQLAMNGAPMQLIAAQLGHKSTRITERHYAHLGDAYKRETIERTLPSFGFVLVPERAVDQSPTLTGTDRRKGRLLRMA